MVISSWSGDPFLDICISFFLYVFGLWFFSFLSMVLKFLGSVIWMWRLLFLFGVVNSKYISVDVVGGIFICILIVSELKYDVLSRYRFFMVAFGGMCFNISSR